jgi:hypothetical protein
MAARARTLSPDSQKPRRQKASGWPDAPRSIARRWVRRLTRRNDYWAIHVPPPPPVCPPGWRTGPPDFVGVGGQRCGTTRWFDLLASHPEVVPPMATKELHYFDRFYTGGFAPADAAGYHKFFPRDGERRAGEWTPLYMAAPWIPRLLAAAAPDARLLVLLRDPVERYLSGLQHDTNLARENGLGLSQLAPLEAFARGLYHAQLRGLLAHFDRSQILVLQYERCTREPLPQLRRTFEFLGLRDTEFVPDLDAHPHRQPSKPSLDSDTLAAYARAYREDVTGLVGAFPEIDVRLWPNFADLAG